MTLKIMVLAIVFGLPAPLFLAVITLLLGVFEKNIILILLVWGAAIYMGAVCALTQRDIPGPSDWI